MKTELFTILLLLAIVGCKTSPEAVAYKTISSIVITVDKAMTAYADLVVAGKVDEATQAKVSDMKGRYEKALTAAVTAAQGATDVPPPDVLLSVVQGLLEIINSIRK